MIKIENLKIKYDQKNEFCVPDLSVNEGEIMTIIGKNGSGKSTVLRAIAGMMPYEGSIKIDEKECKTYNGRDRAKKLSYLPQVLKNANFDVRTLVEHGRYPYTGNFRRLSSNDIKLVEYALEITNMKKYENTNLKDLSGGERQRAFLAMIVAQDTNLILLDEPTTYLDLIYQREMYDIFKVLSKKGKGIITVCHDLQQSFAYSDRICIMDDGYLSSPKTPADLTKADTEIKKVFGVSLKYNKSSDSLYPYLITK